MGTGLTRLFDIKNQLLACSEVLLRVIATTITDPTTLYLRISGQGQGMYRQYWYVSRRSGCFWMGLFFELTLSGDKVNDACPFDDDACRDTLWPACKSLCSGFCHQMAKLPVSLKLPVSENCWFAVVYCSDLHCPVCISCPNTQSLFTYQTIIGHLEDDTRG